MAYVEKDQLVPIFEDTENWYTSDTALKDSIKASIRDTTFYVAEDYPKLPDKKFEKILITVNKQRTFETAFNLKKKYPDAKIAVHNFASATNPGGGVVHGSRAQEEALCRCSTLYPVLNTEENWKRYYKFHRERNDSLYTDACIFTPNITVIKSDVDLPERLPPENWITVDVMTCAAPNLRLNPHSVYNPSSGKPHIVDDDELLKIHERRGRHMLTILANHGTEIFVTGAFGCGAFKNNPEVVAQAYKNILPEFEGYFKEIVFAIYCTPRETKNFDAFDRKFWER